MKLQGRATKLATEAWLKGKDLNCTATVKALDIKVSRVGFGTFRFNKSYSSALQLALSSGINLIDTADHFQSGKSEETIGEVLLRADVSREALCVCSKGGFSFNKDKQMVAEGGIHVKGIQYHNLSPSWLEKQITQSLNRMNLETIDLYLLNNPEILGTQRMYDSIQIALEHLDLEVERGRIAAFGVASNSIHKKYSANHLSLPRILERSQSKNFAVVQYPLNLFEREGVEPDFDGSPSFSEYCTSKGIFQMHQRPLLSISKDGVRKLVTSDLRSEDDINTDATRQFETVIDMEIELSDTIGAVPELSKLQVGQVLADDLTRLVQNELATDLYFKKDLIPRLTEDLKEVQDKFPTLEGEWSGRYIVEVGLLMNLIREMAQYHGQRSNHDLNDIVSVYAFKDASLATNALAVALSASSPTGSSILVGMRQEEHVVSALGAASEVVISSSALEDLFYNPMLM